VRKKQVDDSTLLGESTRVLSLLRAAVSRRLEQVNQDLKNQIVLNNSETETNRDLGERLEKSTRLMELAISFLPMEGFSVDRAKEQLDKNRAYLEAPYKGHCSQHVNAPSRNLLSNTAMRANFKSKG